jgi:hypothetical protein
MATRSHRHSRRTHCARFAVATAMRDRRNHPHPLERTSMSASAPSPSATAKTRVIRTAITNAVPLARCDRLRRMGALARSKGPSPATATASFPTIPRSDRQPRSAARCRELEIEDLRFHDLRHEAASRLFEAGFAIEQVALVTGHKDWKMLKPLHQSPTGKTARHRARIAGAGRGEREATRGANKSAPQDGYIGAGT